MARNINIYIRWCGGNNISLDNFHFYLTLYGCYCTFYHEILGEVNLLRLIREEISVAVSGTPLK